MCSDEKRKSMTPVPTVDHWVTDSTLVADGGTADGINVGDRFQIDDGGEQFEMKVVKVTQDQCVLEKVDTGLESYGRTVSSLIGKRA